MVAAGGALVAGPVVADVVAAGQPGRGGAVAVAGAVGGQGWPGCSPVLSAGVPAAGVQVSMWVLVVSATMSPLLSLCRYRHKDNNVAERALRTPVIGRKNFYGSGAQWAADLAADVWTVTATAARHDIEPLSLLTDYLQACAQRGGTAPAGAGLDPFLPWTPQGRARRRSASDPRQGPGP